MGAEADAIPSSERKIWLNFADFVFQTLPNLIFLSAYLLIVGFWASTFSSLWRQRNYHASSSSLLLTNSLQYALNFFIIANLAIYTLQGGLYVLYFHTSYRIILLLDSAFVFAYSVVAALSFLVYGVALWNILKPLTVPIEFSSEMFVPQQQNYQSMDTTPTAGLQGGSIAHTGAGESSGLLSVTKQGDKINTSLSHCNGIEEEKQRGNLSPRSPSHLNNTSLASNESDYSANSDGAGAEAAEEQQLIMRASEMQRAAFPAVISRMHNIRNVATVCALTFILQAGTSLYQFFVVWSFSDESGSSSAMLPQWW